MRPFPALALLLLLPAQSDGSAPSSGLEDTALTYDPQQDLFDRLAGSRGSIRVACFGGELELRKPPGQSGMEFTFRGQGGVTEFVGRAHKSDLAIDFREMRLILSLYHGMTDYGNRRTSFDFRHFVVPVPPEWGRFDRGR